MRPGRTQAGMSSYRSPHISFHAFTWDRPKNEQRSVWLRLGRRTRHELCLQEKTRTGTSFVPGWLFDFVSSLH